MTVTTGGSPIPAGARVMGYPVPDVGPGDGDSVGAGDRAGAGAGDSAGAGAAPAPRRNPWWYFWTWLVTPHIEFGAVYIGIIVVLYLEMSLVQALIGILLGTAFGSLTHGVLTARGVRLRVPQIVLGRLAFGRIGNQLLTVVMSLVCTFGWFTFNSVVAGLALASLSGMPILAGLAVAVVVQLAISGVRVRFRDVQRRLFPVLTVVMAVAGIIVFTRVDPSIDHGSPWNLDGLIAVVVVACLAWAYTIGWTPFATDYSDHAPSSASPRMAGIASGAGLFVATGFLMCVGVCAGIAIGPTIGSNPTTRFADLLPGWFGAIVLVVLIVGSLSHNVIVLKSTRRLFDVRRLRISPAAGQALGPVVLSLVAFLVGWAATNALAANYEGFVMVVGYLIGPWLNIALVDHLMRRRDDPTGLLYDRTLSNKWGVFAVSFAVVGSVCLYALQIFDQGRLPHGAVSYAALGMLVGFYLAGAIYGYGLKRMLKSHRPGGVPVAG